MQYQLGSVEHYTRPIRPVVLRCGVDGNGSALFTQQQKGKCRMIVKLSLA